jgi:hypothetical protein
MDNGQLIFLGAAFGILTFLFWMLFPLSDPVTKKDKKKTKGNCPVCKTPLLIGEKLKSSQVEIGDYEVQTTIKGCPHCLEGNTARTCPVCKKKLKKEEAIIAFSYPKEDKNRLSIRGCKHCYPQAFTQN